MKDFLNIIFTHKEHEFAECLIIYHKKLDLKEFIYENLFQGTLFKSYEQNNQYYYIYISKPKELIVFNNDLLYCNPINREIHKANILQFPFSFSLDFSHILYFEESIAWPIPQKLYIKINKAETKSHYYKEFSKTPEDVKKILNLMHNTNSIKNIEENATNIIIKFDIQLKEEDYYIYEFKDGQQNMEKYIEHSQWDLYYIERAIKYLYSNKRIKIIIPLNLQINLQQTIKIGNDIYGQPVEIVHNIKEQTTILILRVSLKELRGLYENDYINWKFLETKYEKYIEDSYGMILKMPVKKQINYYIEK